jgi:hypothetical protein
MAQVLDPRVCDNLSCVKAGMTDTTLITKISDRHSVGALLKTAAGLLFIVVPALSHEYWFEPEKLFVGVGDLIRVHLFVGERLKADEERVLQMEKTPRFQMFSAGEIL